MLQQSTRITPQQQPWEIQAVLFAKPRNMDIKYFVLLHEVATGQVIPSAISTHNDPADGLTKSLTPQLFSRHTATLLDKDQSSY